MIFVELFFGQLFLSFETKTQLFLRQFFLPSNFKAKAIEIKKEGKYEQNINICKIIQKLSQKNSHKNMVEYVFDPYKYVNFLIWSL